MKGLEAQFMSGGGEQKTAEDNAEEQQRAKMLKFLEQEGFLIWNSDKDEYDTRIEMLSDAKFKHRLSKLYLGRKEGKIVNGGLIRMRNLLEDLNVFSATEDSDGSKFGDIFNEATKKETPKEKVVNILEKEGIIERKGDYTIVNIDRLKKASFWKDKEDLYIARSGGKDVKFLAKDIYVILSDMEVVSKSDYSDSFSKNRQLETKPLFNVPENVNSAFKAENIRVKKYYLDVWDMYQRIPWNKVDIPTKDGNSIGGRELYLATRIFRDLQGQRGEDDVLRIFDRTKDDFVKASNEKLIKAKVVTSAKSIRKVLTKNCPNLLASGLIRLEDFNIITNSFSGEIFRKEFMSSNPKKPFTTMIKGVNYYIGRKYFIYEGEKIPIENIKVVPLDNTKAGIIKIHGGREELIYTFDLLSDNEKEEKRKSIRKKYQNKISNNEISARTSVRKKELVERIKKYFLTDNVPIKKKEDANSYAQRIAELPDYGYVQKVTDKLSKEIGVGIHNLSWREQLQIAAMEYETGVLAKNSEFMDFARKYKLSGLRSFLSLEHGGQEMGEKILSIGEKLDQKSATAIFAKYGEIVDSAMSVEDYLKEEFGEEHILQVSRIAERLLHRGKALLTVFADDKTISSEKVLEKLERIKGEVELLKESFKNVKQSSEDLSFEDINAVQHRLVSGGELNEDQKIIQEMKKIYLENYKDFPKEFQDKLIESLESKLVNPNTRFYTLYHKNKIVAFNSFTPREDGTSHFANFNIDPDYQFSKLGEAMMEASLDKEAKNATIVAEAVPDTPITKTYLEKKGFKKVGEIEVGEIKLWEIRKERG